MAEGYIALDRRGATFELSEDKKLPLLSTDRQSRRQPAVRSCRFPQDDSCKLLTMNRQPLRIGAESFGGQRCNFDGHPQGVVEKYRGGGLVPASVAAVYYRAFPRAATVGHGRRDESKNQRKKDLRKLQDRETTRASLRRLHEPPA